MTAKQDDELASLIASSLIKVLKSKDATNRERLEAAKVGAMVLGKKKPGDDEPGGFFKQG